MSRKPRKERPYIGFTCTHCDHPDYAHEDWVGRCVHGEMRPKDGLDCDCSGMDHEETM